MPSVPEVTAGAFALSLPAIDLGALHRRVKLLAEPRPGIYRMLDASGRVLYVGKAKRVRARLLSYFHAKYPADKGARILHAASDLSWEYATSEFAAHLAELREIRKWRPPYNVAMNRRRTAFFIGIAEGPAPRLVSTANPSKEQVRYYGPLPSRGRADEAIRVMNDLLGLRDCAERMPMVFAEQGDFFGEPRQAACPRYDFGLCSGPCAGLVTASGYRERVAAAMAFLEGRAIAPVDRIVAGMMSAAEQGEFEMAARWRERFEALEWLLGATTRARAAVELLTFVYRDPGSHGDDRAYLIRRGLVRACYPWPATPIEREAFQGVVNAELAREEPAPGPMGVGTIEEMLLVMSWFRRHPEAFRRTTPLTGDCFAACGGSQ
ncbi:MAG: nuclease [Gemmatimonadales bacterium]|nr:nuclease [Gemmatimonadales bacterium]